MRKKAIIRQKSLLPPLCEKKAERGRLTEGGGSAII